MYTFRNILNWLQQLISRERTIAYLAIVLIVAGVLFGIGIGILVTGGGFSIDFLLGAGGIGIGLPTIISVAYFLYKSDEVEDRQISFLNHVESNLREGRLHDAHLDKGILSEIVIDMVKERLSETVNPPKPKEDAK